MMPPGPKKIDELLRKNLNFYLALKSGKRKPSTDAQKHFVDVVCGGKEPVTEHEWAFIAYELRMEKKQPKKPSIREVYKGNDDPSLSNPFWGPKPKKPNNETDWDINAGGSIDEREDFLGPDVPWE